MASLQIISGATSVVMLSLDYHTPSTLPSVVFHTPLLLLDIQLTVK